MLYSSPRSPLPGLIEWCLTLTWTMTQAHWKRSGMKPRLNRYGLAFRFPSHLPYIFYYAHQHSWGEKLYNQYENERSPISCSMELNDILYSRSLSLSLPSLLSYSSLSLSLSLSLPLPIHKQLLVFSKVDRSPPPSGGHVVCIMYGS